MCRRPTERQSATLDLHHLYRAMAWLGEQLPADAQRGSTRPLAARGQVPEWPDVLQDLERLQYVEVEQDGKRFRLRTQLQGTCDRVFRAVGVAVPPAVQQLA